MKLKSLASAFVLALAHLAASAAVSLSTITFEDLATMPEPTNPSLTSGGFVFQVNSNGFHGIFDQPFESGPTGITKLLATTLGAGLTETFHAVDNSLFNLHGLDLSGFYNFQSTTLNLTLTGTRADNSTVSSIKSVLPNTFTTFALSGFTSLKSVTFSMDSGSQYVAVDNIVISPVPEPETYALMLGGLALVGWAARRRKPV